MDAKSSSVARRRSSSPLRPGDDRTAARTVHRGIENRELGLSVI